MQAARRSPSLPPCIFSDARHGDMPAFEPAARGARVAAAGAALAAAGRCAGSQCHAQDPHRRKHIDSSGEAVAGPAARSRRPAVRTSSFDRIEKCNTLGRYELPEEFETLNVLKDKSKQELDEYFQVDARDDTLHHKFTTKSRIIQLHQTIEHIRAQVAYPPAQQLQMFSQFEQRFAEQVAIGGDDRVESKVYDHSPRADLLVPGESPRADGRRIVRGSNFKQYANVFFLCIFVTLWAGTSS
jgi:hypothetical protein